MNKLIGLVGTNSGHSTLTVCCCNTSKSIFPIRQTSEIVEIKDLPIFNKPADMQIPAEAKALAEKIEAADGVIISTRYDHAVPASLMSALSWLSYGIPTPSSTSPS